jgi:hypothetical protein
MSRLKMMAILALAAPVSVAYGAIEYTGVNQHAGPGGHAVDQSRR